MFVNLLTGHSGAQIKKIERKSNWTTDLSNQIPSEQSLIDARR